MYLSIVLTVSLFILTLTGCFNGLLKRANVKKVYFIIALALLFAVILLPTISIDGININLAVPFSLILMIAASIKKPKYALLSAASAFLLAGIIYMLESILDINEFYMNGLAYAEIALIIIVMASMGKDAVIAGTSAYLCGIILFSAFFIEHALIGNSIIYADMELCLTRAITAGVVAMLLNDTALIIKSFIVKKRNRDKQDGQEVGVADGWSVKEPGL